jgi:hypothetical protein
LAPVQGGAKAAAKVNPKVEEAFGFEPDEWLTVKQLAQMTGMKSPELAVSLNALRQQDRLESETRGSRDVYRLKEPGATEKVEVEEPLPVAEETAPTPAEEAPKKKRGRPRKTPLEGPPVPKPPKEEAGPEPTKKDFKSGILATQLASYIRRAEPTEKMSLPKARKFLEGQGLKPEEQEALFNYAVEMGLLERPYKGQPQDHLVLGELGTKKLETKGPQSPPPREAKRGKVGYSREGYAQELLLCERRALASGDRASALIYQRERLALNGAGQ